MSTITRSFFLKEMREKELVLEAIKRLNHSYNEMNNQIKVDNGVELLLFASGITAKFEEPHGGKVPEKNRFIQEIQEMYSVCFQEKIERLKKEQAKLIENKIMNEIQIKEKREKEIQIKREISNMERIQRLEDNKLRQMIDEKAKLLEERGRSFGYNCEVVSQGSKKILVFTRTL